MDHILHKVAGSKRITMIDGFFGYNHIAVHEDDEEKKNSQLHGEHLCMVIFLSVL